MNQMESRPELSVSANGVGSRVAGDDPRVVAALEEYEAALEAGRPPARGDFLARHAEVAEVLAACLDGLDFVHAARARVPVAEQAAVPGGPELPGDGLPLGDFRILREVGRGGMGMVYEAEQLSLRRRVALKVLPMAGTLDARQLQRFHNEAQAAACLHHTNIVPVFFVGCERGVHFYAMQLIDGQPLSELIHQLRSREKKEPSAPGPEQTTAYQPPAGTAASTPLPAADLTPWTGAGRRGREYYRKVAELGIQAAEALDYAHQLGIVHRDVKPGNLLLDGTGRLWVTDFGLAHMQHGEVSLTLTGQALGTPRYMSPEQALARRVPIDHRTDVYSLGVTLYELLTLRPAFAGEDRQELLRQIAFEEPVRLRKLERAIPAELEIILLKAMEKRPHDRYATAQEMADDLDRWLKHEPIRARRSSWAQVARKWVRRHQAVVWSAAVCFLLMASVLGASLGWFARDQAARQAKVTEHFDQAMTQAGDFLRAEKYPEAKSAAQRAADLLAGAVSDPERQRRLKQLELDLIMSTELELVLLQKAALKDKYFDFESADPAYEAAFRNYNLPVLEMEPEEAAQRIAASAIHINLLAALVDWANIPTDPAAKKKLNAIVRLADRTPWRRKVWDALDQHDGARLIRLAESAEALDQSPARVVAMAKLVALFDKQAAVKLLKQAQQRHSDDFWINHELAFSLMQMEPPQSEEAIGFYRAAVALRPLSPGARLNFGRALRDKGQLDEAIAEYQAAIRLKMDYAEAHSNLAIALEDKGQLEDAIAEHRAAIRIKKDFAGFHINFGRTLRSAGRLDEAIAEYREAIRLNEDYAGAHYNLGVALCDKGRLDEAIAECRKAIQIDKTSALPHSGLGNALRRKGQLNEAIAEYRKAIRLKKNYSEAHNNLGGILHEKGQLGEAMAEFREAIQLKKDNAKAHNNLGNALKDKGLLGEAIAEYREAIRIKKDVAQPHANLGHVLAARGRFDEAVDEYREAIRIKKDYAEFHYDLGNALLNKGRLSEAIEEYRKAIHIKKDLPEAHCNLGHVLAQKGQFDDALIYLRRGHEIGSRNPRWRYPSALWVRNCERLVELDGKLPAILSGQKQPTDTAERLGLAGLCQLPCKKRYKTAERFFREAFAEQPKLAGDLNAQFRYNAACVAALAGCGQGVDADKLDSKERARLRLQALDWLRADLKTYRQVLEKSAGKAGPTIAQRLQHWLDDPDFVGVRDPKALGRLSEAERTKWRRMWEEVTALRQRDAAPPRPDPRTDPKKGQSGR